MKLIIAGSRHYSNYEFVRDKLDYLLRDVKVTEIVSGCATGIDALGERYAKERGIPIARFPADWDTFGNAAGPIRNRKMAEYADALVAFDSGGRGTRNMIEEGEKMNLKIKIVRI